MLMLRVAQDNPERDEDRQREGEADRERGGEEIISREKRLH